VLSKLINVVHFLTLLLLSITVPSLQLMNEFLKRIFENLFRISNLNSKFRVLILK